MDFSHLKQLDVKNKTVDYPIYQIAGEPVLVLKPATEANKPYFNAVLKRSRRNIRAVQSGAINNKMLAENRDEDRELYPRHVIADWKGITDSKGKPVDFSVDACRSFLEALPDWVFDEIRNFAGSSANFTGEVIDVETKAGN